MGEVAQLAVVLVQAEAAVGVVDVGEVVDAVVVVEIRLSTTSVLDILLSG